ncbi:MAG TPA: hypothetical protein VIF15_12890 [Polyangiaceae bacterium]
MTTNKNNSKHALALACGNLAAGITSLPDKEFLLGAQTLTKAQVLAPLDAYEPATVTTATTRGAWSKAVIAERAAEIAAHAMIELLKPFLQARLGKSNPDLESMFGVAPVKPPKVTSAVKAAAAAKAKATRSKLHTLGPKQKKAAKAEATQPAATPPTPQPSPATKPPTA